MLETKYSQPLDVIKDKYIENILQQKQRSKKGFSFGKASEFVIPSIALITIFSIGYWLLSGTRTAAVVSSAPAKLQQEAPAKTSELATNLNTTTVATATPVENNAKVNVEKKQVASAPLNLAVANDQAEERKTNYVKNAKLTSAKTVDEVKPLNKFPVTQIVLPDSKSTVQKNINQSSKQFDPSVINNVPKENVYNDASAASTGDLNALDARPTRRRTNGDDAVNTSNNSSQKNQASNTKNSNTKSSKKYINVPEYIEMSNGSANLKIQNVSDVDLDLVVVDVQYYDASNRFRKGETLYLHNLRAGKNVVVKTPKDTNSQYATSKVSLVSSDARNVYVIGDN